MHENRETSWMSRLNQSETGPAKAHKPQRPDMHVPEESDCAVVCAEQRVAQEG